MKELFRKMLERLGYNPQYVSNFDDVNEGYQYNPTPRNLIEIKLSFTNEYITVYCYTTDTYNSKVFTKMIISGQAIRFETGDIDYDFYEKILRNYNLFI